MNSFIAVSAAGVVQKVEFPPVFNDGTHRAILTGVGSKTVWTPEALSFMSNVSQSAGEVIAIKTKVERYMEENNNSGQQAITQVDVDTIISAKPDLDQFYSAPVTIDGDSHFHSCFKTSFNPADS